MINIKTVDPNKVKIDEKSHWNILISYIEHVMTRNSRYVKINNGNPSFLFINKINCYNEESNWNKYLIPVPTDESKDTLKMYGKLYIKIRDLIR